MWRLKAFVMSYFSSGFPLFLVYFLVREALSQAGADKNDIGDLYKAALDDLSYFNREYQHLDSDALLGLRVAEGTIS